MEDAHAIAICEANVGRGVEAAIVGDDADDVAVLKARLGVGEAALRDHV